MIGVNADIKGFIMFGNRPRTPLLNVINVSAKYVCLQVYFMSKYVRLAPIANKKSK